MKIFLSKEVPLILQNFAWTNIQKIKFYIKDTTVLIKQPYAILLHNDKYVIKICQAQKFPKDYCRKYFGNSQARREYSGAKILNKLNIDTPTPIMTSFNLFPWSKIESIYVMSYLEEYSGLGNINDENLLRKILPLVANDIKIMKDESIIFKDLHFNNIMYNNGKIKWIDTDIKHIINQEEFQKKFNKSIEKLTKKLPYELKKYFLELINHDFNVI